MNIIITIPPDNEIKKTWKALRKINCNFSQTSVTKLDEDDGLCQELYKAVADDFSVTLFHKRDKDTLELFMSNEDLNHFKSLTEGEQFEITFGIIIGYKQFVKPTFHLSNRVITLKPQTIEALKQIIEAEGDDDNEITIYSLIAVILAGKYNLSLTNFLDKYEFEFSGFLDQPITVTEKT
jgi:hypothetical protein